MKEVLEEAGIESADREAEWLLESATGLDRAAVAQADDEVSEMTARRALKLATRRASGEPLQYLTGIAGFRGLELAVGPGVFIPRPETEVLTDRALAHLASDGTLVDVGTGSAAIALAVKNECPDATVYATDNSPAALQWALKNRDALGLDVEIVECDLLDGLPDSLLGKVDVVVSNPPYIATTEEETLAPEVIDHEPHEALFAGIEGLLMIERVARAAHPWLMTDGWIVLETGAEQGRRVEQLVAHAGYADVAVHRDLVGRDRIVEGRST